MTPSRVLLPSDSRGELRIVSLARASLRRSIRDFLLDWVCEVAAACSAPWR